MSNLNDIIIPTAVKFGSSIFRGYQIRNIQTTTHNNPFDGKISQINESDKELYRSLLNTPVLSNITFFAGKYTDNLGVEKVFDSLIYEAVLMNISQAKKIIKTEIQGRDGTVKEYIGMDDYHITINGIITGPNGSYPLDAVRQLKNMLDAPISIRVDCTFLNMLDVHTIVVENYELPRVEGGYSYQQFNIDAISDTIQDVRVISNA